MMQAARDIFRIAKAELEVSNITICDVFHP